MTTLTNIYAHRKPIQFSILPPCCSELNFLVPTFSGCRRRRWALKSLFPRTSSRSSVRWAEVGVAVWRKEEGTSQRWRGEENPCEISFRALRYDGSLWRAVTEFLSPTSSKESFHQIRILWPTHKEGGTRIDRIKGFGAGKFLWEKLL